MALLFTKKIGHIANNSAVKFLQPPTKQWVVPCATNFWEKDKKGGYTSKEYKKPIEKLKEGISLIKPELKKYKQEYVTKFRCDSLFAAEPLDYEIIYQFNDQESVEAWQVTADRDHDEGKSKAQFVLGKHKKGVFSGEIKTEVPKDGVVKRAGYCNIRSPKNMKSFFRDQPFDWTRYTHLLAKVRGDGRAYMVTLGIDRFYDVNWNDQYHYPLYTRGGPYWQIAKIPFSKFFMTGKGRIQDKQEAVDLDKIIQVGITIGDDNPGPFELIVDSIGVIYDPNHTEHFHYEMYEMPAYKLY